VGGDDGRGTGGGRKRKGVEGMMEGNDPVSWEKDGSRRERGRR